MSFLYLALLTFSLTSSFLIYRNLTVWGNPFYLFNNRIFWLDSWDQYFFLSASGEWEKVGAKWFFKHHSLATILIRFKQGLSAMGGLFITSFSAGWRMGPWSFMNGLLILTLSILGLSTQWKEKHRLEVIGITSIGFILFLLFSWHVAGADNQWRYTFPIAVTLFPMAVIGGRRIFLNFSKRVPLRISQSKRFAHTSILIASCLLLFPVIKSLSKNPLNFWIVPEFWNETSLWLKSHINEKGFLINNKSGYSMWECCRDQREIFPYEIPQSQLLSYVEKKGIHYAFLDQSWIPLDPYKEKYGPLDQFGPSTFLNWPRCFHDNNKPSYFLIYSPMCSQDNTPATNRQQSF
jgi:hypothetical protein